MLRLSNLLGTKGFPILNVIVTLGLLLSGTVYAANAPERSWLRQAGTSALQETGAIAGHVTKAVDGTPIANALIVAHNSSDLYVSAQTDASGAYSLTGLPVDTYQVTATAIGHDALAQNGVQVTVNSTKTVNFALQASQPVNQGGSLTGHVRAASSGDAISGATVLLMQGSSVLLGATADTNGLYGFIGIVAAGTYSAVAFAPGYQPATQANIAIAANQTTALDFSLTLIQTAFYGALQGKVTNASTSAPVSGAQVKATLGADTTTATTDAQGNYELTNLPVETYSLGVTATGYQTFTLSNVLVSANAATTVNFALQAIPTGAIAGAVTNAANTLPIQAAQVQAMSGATVVATAVTDANGHYALASLATGSYSLQVSATGFQSASQDNVAVAANAATTVNFALQAVSTGAIAGAVTNAANSQPIQVAQVQAMSGATVVATAATDANGHYALASLATGSYSLQASVAGFQSASQGNVAVSANATTTVNFALQGVAASPLATGSLIGQVVNAANGEPVAEAVALLRERMPLPILSTLTEEMVAQTTTDSAGKYSFTGLEPGIYRLRVQAEGFHKVTTDNIAILAGQTAVVNVALQPKQEWLPRGAITGQVTDAATGEAIEGAVVFFTPSHGVDKDDHDRRFTRTDDHGIYILENLPAGDYQLHVQARGYKPDKVKDVTVKAGEQTTVDVTLDAVPGRGHKEDNGNDDHGKNKLDDDDGEKKGRGRGKLNGSISLQSVLTTGHSLVFPDIQTAFDR